jgi:F420-non-reducing hydrogenase iron-sulfur subunit
MRLEYPSDIRIIKVPCTGKVDIIHILRSFEKGADGVYVVGCLEGACQFNSGNIRARKRVEQAGRILDRIGVGGERVRMYNLSSGEGTHFAEFAREMSERIRKMGPNPVKTGKPQKAA